jgi:beta-lactam-binding protein with PASTA domain
VPDLVGVQLDVAEQRLAARKFEADVQGGGVFKEMFSTLHVVKQSPKAGTYLEQGSAVRIIVK